MAASLAEIISMALNKSDTLYLSPAISPTLLGMALAARLVVTTVASGLSTGINVIAVSTLSVLAGRYQPCGSLAASTCPVSASATTQAEALILSKGLARLAGWLTITPVPASCGPPIVPDGCCTLPGRMLPGRGAAAAAVSATARHAAAALSSRRPGCVTRRSGRPPGRVRRICPEAPAYHRE